MRYLSIASKLVAVYVIGSALGIISSRLDML